MVTCNCTPASVLLLFPCFLSLLNRLPQYQVAEAGGKGGESGFRLGGGIIHVAKCIVTVMLICNGSSCVLVVAGLFDGSPLASRLKGGGCDNPRVVWLFVCAVPLSPSLFQDLMRTMRFRCASS